MTITRAALVAALVGVVCVACATAQEFMPIGLAGVYDCKGDNPDGSTYTGQTTITETGNETVSLAWTFPPNGGARGVGLRRSDTLSVIFQTSDGGLGLAAYAIARDGEGVVTLTGRWTAPGQPIVSVETLTRSGLAPATRPVPPVVTPPTRPQPRGIPHGTQAGI